MDSLDRLADTRGGARGQVSQRSMSFRWNYPDQVRDRYNLRSAAPRTPATLRRYLKRLLWEDRVPRGKRTAMGMGGRPNTRLRSFHTLPRSEPNDAMALSDPCGHLTRCCCVDIEDCLWWKLCKRERIHSNED